MRGGVFTVRRSVEIHTVNTRERATGRNVLLLAYP
jgi:hypothetical protein